MDYDEMRAALKALNATAEKAAKRRVDALAEHDEAHEKAKAAERSATAIKTLLREAGEPYEKDAPDA